MPVLRFALCRLVLCRLILLALCLAVPLGKASEAAPLIAKPTGDIEHANSPDGTELDRAMLEAIGMVELETETPFTDGPVTFRGVRMQDLLRHVGGRGETIEATALDLLKIDQTFIRDIETDANDRAIIDGIINLAKSLGLKTIAEGLKTEHQRDFLLSAGCHLAQGFLYNPALSHTKILPYLQARTGTPVSVDLVSVGI